MTRDIQQSFRISSESTFTDEVNLVFLKITHDSMTPITVVNDTVDYMLDDEFYIGFPFEIEILSDNESPPTAKLSIQNVDPQIGIGIRSLMSPPRLEISLYSSDDWNTETNPRSPWDEPTLVYNASRLFLINVSVDIMTISGQIVGWDYLQRVWPGPRAMQAVFPGLFR